MFRTLDVIASMRCDGDGPLTQISCVRVENNVGVGVVTKRAITCIVGVVLKNR